MIEFKILEKTPGCARDKSHHYCDYIELLALCGDVDGVSNSDIYARFYNDGRIGSIGTDHGAESNESWVSEINQWFEELRTRTLAYDDKYPFEFDNQRFALKANLNSEQYVYLGLLLCSSLKYIEGSSILSSAFELASLYTMKKYLPEMAQVHVFGVSSRSEGRYSGSLETKVRKLSDDTNYPVSSRPNIFRTLDNGDGGVDIISWLPFENDRNLDKKLLFVGQSASTMSWANKQHSVDRLNAYLDIEHKSLSTLYVPYDMRDSDRNITEWTLITIDILFDRHRMLELLDPEELFSGELGQSFKALIESAIVFEEDIV